MGDVTVETEDKKEATNGDAAAVDTIADIKSGVASDLEKKIIRQIEHYFGDYNMPKDKFLQEALQKEDGWVDMETMFKFKRLAALTEDPSLILAALKKSRTGLMEVKGEGGEGKIRRSPSLPLPDNSEEFKKDTEARTVYLKGFPKETTTLDDLIEFFHGGFENVLNVYMRMYFDKKTKERHFKGSVMVTFKDVANAQKLVALEEIKYKDEPLIKKFQKVYFEDKSKEMDEKRKLKQQNKEKVMKAKGDENVENKEDEFALPKGATLKLTGLGGEITREDIKEKLKELFEVNIDKDGGDIAFITYNKGDEEAKIRFREENAAKPIAEKWLAKEKVEISEMSITASLLEGEEEEKFLSDSVQDLKERRNKNRHGHKRRGGFQGGRGGKRGRRH